MSLPAGTTRTPYILGVFCCFHDASACLIHGGQLVAMAEEERFVREKHTSRFPEHAIRFCLEKAGISYADVDAVYYGFRPWAFLWQQVASGVRNLPRSLNLLRKGASYMPLGEKVRGMLTIPQQLRRCFGPSAARYRCVEHHLAHAYGTYFVSPFSEAAIFITDGFGETVATTFAHGKGDEISTLSSVSLPDSLGIYYGAVTQYLGFRPHGDEYKVMGMAAYGKNAHLDFFETMLRPDGALRFRMDTSYFDLFTHGVNKWFSDRLVAALGPARPPGGAYEQRHFDIARSAQTQLENVAVALVTALRERTGCENLCVGGGVGQNVLMNRQLLDRCGFKQIYVPPVAYDGGISLGAAYAGYRRDFGGSRQFELATAGWGDSFSDEECRAAIEQAGLAESVREFDDASPQIARAIADGKVVGYFEGGMELGPRALGMRSILADPRRKDIKDILNSRIKNREFFRPFAPMVTVEDCSTYFDISVESPFMTLVAPVKTPDLLPGITHEDGTARVQTVSVAGNPSIHRLLRRFAELSGVPVLLNTSFNENEPIVRTPQEALACFTRTKMDVVAFNNRFLLVK